MPFQMDSQTERNWCWAAVSASVDRYFDPGSALTECEIAAELLEANDCCANPKRHDKPAKLQDALELVGRLGKIQDGPIAFSDLRSELDAGRPVCVRIEWHDGSAHFVVLYGYRVMSSGTRTVEVADPWYPDSTQSFDFFPVFYHGGGEWAATYLTQ